MANAAYLTVGRRSCPYREAAQNYGEKREEKLVYGVEFRMPMPSYTALHTVQSWAKERAIGCMNSPSVARGSLEAGLTQPRANSFSKLCICIRQVHISMRLCETRLPGYSGCRLEFHATSQRAICTAEYSGKNSSRAQQSDVTDH